MDSVQFMNASLDTLVTNLNQSGGLSRFQHLMKHTEKSKAPLLLRKGVYCYEYMDGPKKFELKSLPPIGAFYSSLTEETISQEDYKYAQEVWQTFSIQNLGQYHDLYLLTDTLLLADVFDNFREFCFDHYGLDCLHFQTLPSLSWQACLKMTKVRLELLTDPTMYNFCEEMLRGGISTINRKHAKANNPHIDDYNPDEKNSYILYLDANNLYGYAMSDPLPISSFQWLTPDEIRDFDLTRLDHNQQLGYFLDVDLAYPHELHNSHNSYPLAPEKLRVDETMLSNYSKDLYESLFPEKAKQHGESFTYKSVPKLIPNLNDKVNYILHGKTLSLYLRLGMKVERINRVLRFVQYPWLKPYIEFNTDMRKKAKNSFEKDLFKLFNNAIFGKTLENVRKRQRVELVSTNQQRKTKKLIASPAFKSFTIINENLASIHMEKTTVTLNRPVYAGVSILDISKWHMYSFHYDVVKSVYGEKADVCFSDTDSLCYFIETDDLYGDLKSDRFPNCFDFSDYPETHPLYSAGNKKKLGYFKDETKGIPISEFVGLRSKMYSMIYGNDEKKTAKGIKKYVMKKYLKHEGYKEALFREKSSLVHMTNIRSFSHQLYTIQSTKTGLSPFDDKRYVLDDKFTTLAYGHFKIQ